MISLKNKVAVITGASQGIGKGIAIKFSELGAKVVLCSKSANCKSVAKEIISKGKEALSVQADVSNNEDVITLFKETFKKFNKIDILINNAGITRDNFTMRISDKDWDTVININLKGSFLCSKEAMRFMIKQKSGVIINISSIIALTGNVGQSNYAASKAGMIAMTKSMALELSSRQIRVNSVAPGFIETNMTKKINEEQKKDLLQKIPLKRFGKVNDISNFVSFLSSDLASYITGQVFVIDGGLIIGKG